MPEPRSTDGSAATIKVEYGLRIDCEANGCDPKHADDGDVVPRSERKFRKPHAVSGHAAQLVKRTITTSPWERLPMEPETHSSAATPLDEWREQERERERTRYPFAAPEAERCEAVRRAAGNPFDKSDWTILYRCGKRKGHEGRHDCADEGWSMKWATL